MKKLFPLFIMLLGMSAVYAQQAVKVAIYNEAIGLPSSKIISLPLHPTLQLGWDFRSRGAGNWKRTTGVDFYTFYHKRMETAFMLDLSHRLAYQTPGGFQAGFTAAAGYKHAILDGQKYKLHNGEYVKAAHWGKSQVNLKAGLSFEQKISENIALTVDYRVMAVYPFGDRIIPFTINHFTGLGVKKYLN